METNRIFVTLNGTFKDEEKCRVAMETIVKDAHAAYGVNSHFWCRSIDGKSLFVLEQYEEQGIKSSYKEIHNCQNIIF